MDKAIINIGGTDIAVELYRFGEGRFMVIFRFQHPANTVNPTTYSISTETLADFEHGFRNGEAIKHLRRLGSNVIRPRMSMDDLFDRFTDRSRTQQSWTNFLFGSK